MEVKFTVDPEHTSRNSNEWVRFVARRSVVLQFGTVLVAPQSGIVTRSAREDCLGHL